MRPLPNGLLCKCLEEGASPALQDVASKFELGCENAEFAENAKGVTLQATVSFMNPDPSTISPTLGIERIEILLLIAAVVSMLVRRLNLPYTVGLTFAGIAIALLSLNVDIPFTKEVIFSAFLPPLIFEAAFAMHWRELKRNIGIVTSLATVGVVLSIALTTAGLFYIARWPFLPSLILGVLISATDPVSVIATFKEAGVTGRLRLLVEAESLFNDGTVAVIFGVAVAAVGATSALSAGGIAITFLTTVFGGILCGAAVGYGAVWLAGRTDDHLIEITFTSIAAYGSFLLAEHYHLSGVLATLTAGVIVGNVGSLGAITDRGHEAVESFWEYVGFVANSLIFLLIGIRLAKVNILAVWLPVLVTILFVTLGRAVAVYGVSALWTRSNQRVSRPHKHILFWGGLRGALALALALGLPAKLELREDIITVAFAAVAFSVIVQGLTVTPLLRYLGEIHDDDAANVEGAEGA